MLTEKYKLPLLLSVSDLCDNKKTGRRGLLHISRPTLYRRLKEGSFPQPVERRHVYVVWSGYDIEKYLDKLLSGQAV